MAFYGGYHSADSQIPAIEVNKIKRASFIVLFLFLFTSLSRASDFDLWENLYREITNMHSKISLKLLTEKSYPLPYNLEFEMSHNPDLPIDILRVEYDGKNVKSHAAILKTGREAGNEKFTVRYGYPGELLKPGFHIFLVEIGNSYDGVIQIVGLVIDPELNIDEATRLKGIKEIFGKAQEQRAKTQTLDCRFNLSASSQKGKTKVEQRAEGRIDITGEDLFSYTLACIPEVKVNGRRIKGKGAESFVPLQKKGSRLLLSPYHLAYYIPYDDLFNYYNWNLYKRIGPKVWMMGSLIHRDQWLPQFIKLVMDEKRGLPLEVNAYIYNKQFAAATARIEYDKNGLPIKQIVGRRLPGGEQETSTLILTNLEPNKRAPKKRWFLF